MEVQALWQEAETLLGRGRIHDAVLVLRKARQQVKDQRSGRETASGRYEAIMKELDEKLAASEAENFATLRGDCYLTLGIPRTANVIEVKRGYRAMALKYHPDKNQDVDTSELFNAIQHAYETLCDDDARADYRPVTPSAREILVARARRNVLQSEHRKTVAQTLAEPSPTPTTAEAEAQAEAKSDADARTGAKPETDPRGGPAHTPSPNRDTSRKAYDTPDIASSDPTRRSGCEHPEARGKPQARDQSNGNTGTAAGRQNRENDAPNTGGAAAAHLSQQTGGDSSTTAERPRASRKDPHRKVPVAAKSDSTLTSTSAAPGRIPPGFVRPDGPPRPPEGQANAVHMTKDRLRALEKKLGHRSTGGTGGAKAGDPRPPGRTVRATTTATQATATAVGGDVHSQPSSRSSPPPPTTAFATSAAAGAAAGQGSSSSAGEVAVSSERDAERARVSTEPLASGMRILQQQHGTERRLASKSVIGDNDGQQLEQQQEEAAEGEESDSAELRTAEERNSNPGGAAGPPVASAPAIRASDSSPPRESFVHRLRRETTASGPAPTAPLGAAAADRRPVKSRASSSTAEKRRTGSVRDKDRAGAILNPSRPSRGTEADPAEADGWDDIWMEEEEARFRAAMHEASSGGVDLDATLFSSWHGDAAAAAELQAEVNFWASAAGNSTNTKNSKTASDARARSPSPLAAQAHTRGAELAGAGGGGDAEEAAMFWGTGS